MSEKDLLDNMVEEYGMNIKLCTHASRHISGESVSDVVYGTFEQFVTCGIANKEFGIGYDKLDAWGPVECRTFYRENLLDAWGMLKGAYMKHLTENQALTKMVGNFPRNVTQTLEWRYTHGYSFLNYRGRVDRFLTKQIEDKAKEGQEIIKNMDKILASIESLRGENEQLQKSSIPTGRLKRLVAHVVENMKVSDILELGLDSDQED